MDSAHGCSSPKSRQTLYTYIPTREGVGIGTGVNKDCGWHSDSPIGSEKYK